MDEEYELPTAQVETQVDTLVVENDSIIVESSNSDEVVSLHQVVEPEVELVESEVEVLDTQPLYSTRSTSETTSASFYLAKGADSREYELNHGNLGFPPYILTIENDSSSQEDVQYVVYRKKTVSGRWESYTSSWIDISPGSKKEINIGFDYSLDQTRIKVKLTNDGWTGDKKPVSGRISIRGAMTR